MQCRVDNLLRLPELGRHLVDLALLVCHDQLFRVFEAALPRRESPTRSRDGSATGQKRTIVGPGKTENSPRVGDAGCMAHAAPVRAQVVLRLGQLPIARQGGGHGEIVSNCPRRALLRLLLCEKCCCVATGAQLVVAARDRGRLRHGQRTARDLSLVVVEEVLLGPAEIGADPLSQSTG